MQLQVFASSGLRLALAGHFSAQLALAAPAGVGQGQGVSVRTATAKSSQAGANTIKKSAKITTQALPTIQRAASVPVVDFPSKPKQQTAKEVIAANVQLLIEQLESGHSEGLTAYLTAMGQFHKHSFGNILEIARQKPNATQVAGLYAWNQLGRKVKKGERGIRILAPMTAIQRKADAEAGRDIRTQNQPVLVGFRSVYVFDVAQTEGQDIPVLAGGVSGEAGEYRERLIDFTIAQGIQIEFKKSIAPALGMSYGGRIALLSGQGSAEEFSTLVHELAHEMLNKADRRTATTKTVRERETEKQVCFRAMCSERVC